MTRTMDAARFNAIANHPDVRPWLGGDGDLDFGPLLRDASHFALIGETGGFIAVEIDQGRYEIHSLFQPDRGATACRAMREGLDDLFSATDAWELVTRVPTDNLAALGLARLAGFTPAYRSEMPWTGGTRKAVDVCGLSIAQWAGHSAAAKTAGITAHELIAAAAPASAHAPDDDMHYQFSGAAWLLLQQGNAMKAERLYREYAQMTGHQPFRVLRILPVVIDLGDGLVVEIRGTQTEVLTCQPAPLSA